MKESEILIQRFEALGLDRPTAIKCAFEHIKITIEDGNTLSYYENLLEELEAMIWKNTN